MTINALAERARGHLTGGKARFDPITLLILSTIISTVIGHYLERWLERCEAKSIRQPGWWARYRLRGRIRDAFTDVHTQKTLWLRTGVHVDGKAMDREYGDEVHAALLAMAAELTDEQIQATLRPC